jgi:hypothetical protein
VVRGKVDRTVKYEVTVTREDGLWVADITGEGLGPAATDAARFEDLDDEVRDLIAGLTDVGPDEIEFTWRYVIGGQDVTDALEMLRLAERGLRSAQEAHEAVRQVVLLELRDAGLTQSAIGDVLGVSHQRVHQLLKVS